MSINALTDWSDRFGLPDFSAIRDENFAPALDAAFDAHNAEIESIVTNEDAPSIDNSLKALELSGDQLEKVASLFFCRAGAHTNDTIQATEREYSAKFAQHFSSISMNPKLFARIDALYRQRDALDLDPETLRVLEKSWKNFVRAGAKLDEDGKKRLAEIQQKLANLGTQFGQNVLKDEADWVLFLDDESDLAGLPDSLLAAMRSAAHERGQEDKWALTLSRSIVEPFLSLSANRALREKLFTAFTSRGAMEAETNNWQIIADTLVLRNELASLLGYESYAAYKLDDTMAKTPDAVRGLLQPVWQRALVRADQEEKALQTLAASEGANHAFAAWDWRYYAEKRRQADFDIDEAEVKNYFELDNIINAAFWVAEKLFGICAKPIDGIVTWHEDVRAFEIVDTNGKHLGLFLGDYFARSSKRSGAWMSALQSQHGLDGGQTPIIYNVCNFAKPPVGERALLSLTDARTLFHEFGHALHGLLSDVVWPSVSGTSVSRDFVELPSQLFEHWLMRPEVLEKFALHTETGEPIPTKLIDKIKAAAKANVGFEKVEFTASALMDMAYHEQDQLPSDPKTFQTDVLAKLGLPDTIAMRHASPHFLHVFAGDGYSAGYYSYMWSGVLDSDAFAAFEEVGDVFDKATADKLEEYIYSAGGSADPEQLYIEYRGKLPSPEAMMIREGLMEEGEAA